jgi:hypothetical protein
MLNHSKLMALVVLVFFSLSFAQNTVIIYPNLGENKAEKLTAFMNQISSRLNNNYKLQMSIKMIDEMPTAGEKDRIVEIGREEGYNRVIYLNISPLGNKVFYNVAKYNCGDGSVIFSDDFTVMGNEDFEVLVERFAKMLGEDIPWAKTISLDHVTERDAQKRKQGSFGHFGAYLATGIGKPFGESLTRQEAFSYIYSIDVDKIQPSQFMQLSFGLTYDVRKYFIDAEFAWIGWSGMSMGLGGGYFIKDQDISPYCGINVSATWIWNSVPDSTSEIDYWDSTTYTYYDYKTDVGLGITARLGARFLRSHFFQPFVELNGVGVIGSRFEKYGVLRFGLAAVF